MRETNFIKQNKDKWKAFEQILEQEHKDPEKLNRLFVQITDDLSYSRTFYHNRSVRVYLNHLAQKIFRTLYKTRATSYSRFISFWTDELPMLVQEAKAEFRVSFFLFLLAFLIGALSCAMEPEFVRVILGDSYVDMTLENIQSGDPMKVYKEKGEFNMTLGITMNNLFVAFLTFIMGVFYAIGTIGVLISNGVMVGAFQYFFYEQGVLTESLLTIWIHGTLEISAIIIAGAAGLTMGKGLVFPKTYSRLQAFQISARRGLKIMMGIVPIFILAGFFEGYLTRHTEAPQILRAIFILSCLAFVVFYFIWYPQHRAKKGFKTLVERTTLAPDNPRIINFNHIKPIGGLFSDTFMLYRKYFSAIFKLALLSASIFSVAVFSYIYPDISGSFTVYSDSFSIWDIGQYFAYESIFFIPILNVLLFTLIALSTYQLIAKEQNKTTKTSTLGAIFTIFKISIPIAIVVAIFAINEFWSIFLMILLFPFLLLWTYSMYNERIHLFDGFGRAIHLITQKFETGIGLCALLLVISIIFYTLSDTMLFWFYADFIGWNLGWEGESLLALIAVLKVFSSVLLLFLAAPIYFIGMALWYHSQVEILEATYLYTQIQQIGKNKQIQGLAQE